jgi:hypothetical protein
MYHVTTDCHTRSHHTQSLPTVPTALNVQLVFLSTVLLRFFSYTSFLGLSITPLVVTRYFLKFKASILSAILTRLLIGICQLREVQISRP